MKLSMSFRAKILSHHYYSEAKPKNLLFLTRWNVQMLRSCSAWHRCILLRATYRGVKRAIVFGAVRSEQCLSRVDM